MEHSLPNLKYLCACKHPENAGGRMWSGVCVGCCSFCKEKKCRYRSCDRSRKDLCTWRRGISEWLLGRIDGNADRESYQRRRVEHYLRQGYKEGDGTWEGNVIRHMRERYGKDFGKME